MKALLSWIVLGTLLAISLVIYAQLDRRDWPGVVGDEATYIMQAESLAYDFDLAYQREDYDRFLAHWNHKPEGLILQTHDGGNHLTFGKPIFYSLYLAPFFRISPARGLGVANLLLLALAAVMAARALRASVGDFAPVWVATFLFGSVTFAYLSWAHADLFLMCLTAIAYALVYGDQQATPDRFRQVFEDPASEPGRRFWWRWGVVGGALTMVGLSRPFYFALLLPVLFALPERRRGKGLMALLAGALAVGLLSVLLSLVVHGSWTSYGGERLGFYSYTGFPRVDLPSDDWQAQVDKRGNGNWIAPEKLMPYDFEPRLTAWNALYFLVGRNVGLLPYFLPVVLGLLAYRSERFRWSLWLAAALAMAGFFYIRPLNFYGGGAAIANRYFLPIYPLFWFLAARSLAWFWPLLAALAAGPFLWNLWTSPLAYPIAPEGGFRYVTATAQRYLPHETTQEQLKPAGQEDLIQKGIWIKLLTPGLRNEDGGQWISMAAGSRAELLIGREKELSNLTLEFASGGPSEIELKGALLGEVTLHPTGAVAFEARLSGTLARHRMWWTSESFNLYRLVIKAPETAIGGAARYRFRLAPL